MVIEGLKRAFSRPDSPLKIESGGVATVSEKVVIKLAVQSVVEVMDKEAPTA